LRVKKPKQDVLELQKRVAHCSRTITVTVIITGSNMQRLQLQKEVILMQRSNDFRKEQIPDPEFDFGKPYHGTRKRSKFDYGEDLVVVPVEID
jgi:hypothetical protein